MTRRSHLRLAGFVSIALLFGSDLLVFPSAVSAQGKLPMTFQQFEHGFMLGNKFGVEVFPYNEEDRLAFSFSENDISTLKENAVANLPPDRDYQPGGDFGKLWSNSLRIMQALGWAITPPVQYIAEGGAASGIYTSLPISGFSVKTNDASIEVGLSNSSDFTLLNGNSLHAEQLIWIYAAIPYSAATVQNCNAQQIQFYPGGYSAMMQGGLGLHCRETSYLLRAMAQQKMTVFAFYQNRPIIGMVVAPGGAKMEMPRTGIIFDGVLPSDGNYSIHLMQDSSGPEPIFPDNNQSEQHQFNPYTMLIVIR